MLHIHLCHLCQLIVYTSPIYGLGCQHEQSGIRSCNKAPITFKFHPYRCRTPRASTSPRGPRDAPPRRPMEMALARPPRCSCCCRKKTAFHFALFGTFGTFSHFSLPYPPPLLLFSLFFWRGTPWTRTLRQAEHTPPHKRFARRDENYRAL